MEPMYVDNVSSAMNALWAAWREEKMKNDEHYKHMDYPEGSPADIFKLASSLASHISATVFKTYTGGQEPEYLHIWVDSEKRLIPTFPINATRETMLDWLRCASNLIAVCPITQQEERESRG